MMVIDWGPFREYFLFEDIVIIALLGQIACIFIWYYIKRPESKIRLFFGIAFLGVAVSFAFRSVRWYFFDEDLIARINMISAALVICLFSFNVEGVYGKILKTKRVMSILSTTVTILLIIFLGDLELSRRIFFFLEFCYVFPLYFLHRLFQINQGILRKKMKWAFIGFFLILIPTIVSDDTIREFLYSQISFEQYLSIIAISKYCIFGGLIILVFAFDVDIFLETAWLQELLDFYVIDPKSGACLYHRKFQNLSSSEPADIFVTMGITGIVGLVQEFTKSDKDVEAIDTGKGNIYLERSKTITGVFVTRIDLAIFPHFLRLCTTQFETYFGDFISTYDSTSENLNPVMDLICDEILQINQSGRGTKE